VKRLLARPPTLSLKNSFAKAYRAGRFTQLELISDSDLISEARKHDLALNRETLETLDRHAVFTPVAFAGPAAQGHLFEPRWNVDELTFRDESGYRRWGHYAFREDGVRRVLPLYSPWQMMYLKSALEERSVNFTLPFLLGRRERLLGAISDNRAFWRAERDFWLSLEQNWRPVVLLLCWLQNRYLPFVRGQTTRVYVPGQRQPVDPVAEEVRSFDAAAFLDKLGLTVEDIRRAYQQLAHIGCIRDPIEDWYMVVRAAPPRAHEGFEGDARLAQLIYDGAEVCRRFLHSLTGVVEPDCDEVYGDPKEDRKQRWLGHERRLYYDRDDFKRILERKRLSPFGVHVFVEGPSDKELLGGLIDAIWGGHRRLVRGIDKVARQELFEAFSTYARKALLVTDDEGKIARDLKRLRKSGLLVDEDSFHSWKRNIGLARIVVDDARQQGVKITKSDIAVALRERILAELEDTVDEKPVVEGRPVLGLALGIGRYSMS